MFNKTHFALARVLLVSSFTSMNDLAASQKDFSGVFSLKAKEFVYYSFRGEE